MFALPWVLVALLLQVAGPVEAARMAAQMADPFAAMPICSPGQGQGGAGDHQSPTDRHGGHDCNLCSACAPIHADAPPIVAQPLPRLSVAELSQPQFAVQASPRGPPLRTTRARAPPSPLQTA